MSEWTDGYRAALRDVMRVATDRQGWLSWLDTLVEDLNQDALVIEHEQGNRLQRRRMRAAREALPLFTAAGEAE
jgi:hypothetical protein